MTAFNLSNLSAANDTIQIFTAVNTLSGGVIGWSILTVVWIFAFLNIRDNNRVKMAAASFVTTLVSVGLLVTGLIGNSTMWIVGFIMALSMVFLFVPARE